MKFDKPIVTFDIETTLSCFLFGAKFHNDSSKHVFEISWRRDDKQDLLTFLAYLKQIDAHMVGYNNLNFDYPIIHELMLNPHGFHKGKSYEMAQTIIDAQKFNGGKRPSGVQLYDRLIHQIDLMKIWHYDNDAKRTRLKDLQFAMRSETVEDLPYDFRQHFSEQQIEDYRAYMWHDITETEKFLDFSMERVELRRDLIRNRTLPGDVLNWNDTKLGEQMFVQKLGLKGKVRGTDRLVVNFKDIMLDKIQFRRETFQEVRETFETKRWIKDDKDQNKTISFQRNFKGVDFKFGSGGLHASVENKVFHTSDTHKILDIDVSSYYPSGAIVNGIFPEHLGQIFTSVYKQVKIERKQYGKETADNRVRKLALNGVFGKMNSEYSPMFDMKALLGITINCQLQLLQLVEMLFSIPDLDLIQANTDGLTLRVPRHFEWMFDMWKKEWEYQTGYELEQVEYKSMWISDVNNYLCIDMNGKKKRKGKYWFGESWKDYDEGPGHWHTDQSMTVVAKVAEQVMLYGHNPEFILRTMTDPFDFMMRQKIKGEQKGFIGARETQKTVRYYVSKAGEPFKVIRPASGPVGQYKRKNKLTDKFFETVLKEIGLGVWDERIHTGKAGKPETQGRYEDTESKVCSGYLVKDCCDSKRFDWKDVDYDFYLAEIEKIIIRG